MGVAERSGNRGPTGHGRGQELAGEGAQGPKGKGEGPGRPEEGDEGGAMCRRG